MKRSKKRFHKYRIFDESLGERIPEEVKLEEFVNSYNCVRIDGDFWDNPYPYVTLPAEEYKNINAKTHSLTIYLRSCCKLLCLYSPSVPEHAAHTYCVMSIPDHTSLYTQNRKWTKNRTAFATVYVWFFFLFDKSLNRLHNAVTKCLIMLPLSRGKNETVRLETTGIVLFNYSIDFTFVPFLFLSGYFVYVVLVFCENKLNDQIATGLHNILDIGNNISRSRCAIRHHKFRIIVIAERNWQQQEKNPEHRESAAATLQDFSHVAVENCT